MGIDMLWKIYACFLIVVSVVTFGFYAVDKIKAIKREWRIPEKVLLFLSFFGGGVGGYTAMFLTEHKIRKLRFHVVNLLGIAWHLAVLILLL